MKTILTYGTFDLFHIGHLNILERASALGDRLVVGVSTDEFNTLKGKKSIFPYEHRARIVESLKFVHQVVPENDWSQKETDITRLGADVFVMGHDWEGKFDNLKSLCEVKYLPRTDGISTTELKAVMAAFKDEKIEELMSGLESLKLLIHQLN